MVGKGKQNAIVTLAEHVTGMTLIRRVGQCASIPVLNAIIDMNTDVVIDTLSIDNGKEFSLHEMIAVINGKREVKRGPDIVYAN